MTACPSCPRTWSTEETLAAHLIDAHGFEAKAAVERARAAVKDQAKIDRHAGTRSPRAPRATEDDMSKNADRTGECPECHRLRHVKGCSQHFRSKSKQPAKGPTAAKKGKAMTRRHPKAPAKASSSGNGSGMLEELDALRAVATALDLLPDVDARARVIALTAKLFAIERSA